MNAALSLIPAILLSLAVGGAVEAASGSAAEDSGSRIRLIVETDAGGDPDDEQSLVRFLLYANEWDVEGIIANRPQTRRPENKNPADTGVDVVRRLLDAYGQCRPNLAQHDPRYPGKAYLWQRTVPGYDDTDEAVSLILAAVDKDDPRPLWGSWAGRYGPNENFPGKRYYWANQADSWKGTRDRDNTLARWAADLQNDFLARLDWCVKSPPEANHAPRAVVNSVRGKEILRIAARPGQQVSFDAGSSRDPDGDPLAFEWFVYPEAGTYRGQAVLRDASSTIAVLSVPEDAGGETIHVVLAVRDSGSPPLAAYRRAVVQVAHKHD